MKRVLTCLVAAVVFGAVSFVQAANVELKFYSAASGEEVSVAKDLHFALVGVDGNTLVKGNLDADGQGKVEADVESTSFYVVAEQSSTKFFGSVLIAKDVVADELFFVLDESGLTWLKDAHRCSDEECKANRDENEKSCLDEDFCDENCVCRKLDAYCSNKAKLVESSESYAQAAEGDVSANVIARSVSGVNTTSPYSSGVTNLGSLPSAGGAVGRGGTLAMVGVAVALGVALPVALGNKEPKSRAGTAIE